MLLDELDDLISGAPEKQTEAGTTAPTPGKFNFSAHAVSLDMHADFPKSHSFVFGEGKQGLLPMA